MNRLFLMSALIGLGVAGCEKSPDSAKQNVEKTVAADTAHSASGAAAADTAHGNARHDSAATNAASQSTATESDVTGGYFAMEKLPAEFSEIDFMGLATIDENAKPAPLNGFLRPKKKSAKDYHLIAPTLSGADLTFTTETINGVSYSFTGTFSTLGNFPENPPATDLAVLKGTLKKMKDGTEVAKTPVSFSYSAGG